MLAGVQVSLYLQAAWSGAYSGEEAFARQFWGVDAAWLERQRQEIAAANGGKGPLFVRAFPSVGVLAAKFAYVVIEWADDRFGEDFLGGGRGFEGARVTQAMLTHGVVRLHVLAPTPEQAEILWGWVRSMMLLADEPMIRLGYYHVGYGGSGPVEPASAYMGEGGGVWQRTQTWELEGTAQGVAAEETAAIDWWVELSNVKTTATTPPYQSAPVDPLDPLPPNRTLDDSGTPGGVQPVEE